MRKTMKAIKFCFLFIICMSFSMFKITYSQSSEDKITLWVKIHRIIMIDSIENPSQPEYVDWHYFLTIKDDGAIYNEDSENYQCGENKVIATVYEFEITSRYVRIHIDLVDNDLYTRQDLADISGHTGGGIDNYEGFTRGTRFSAVYDIRNNRLMDTDAFTEKSGYYVTSGEYDGSTDTDENDAELWFSIWDDYDLPKAKAGPDRYCYTGREVNFDGTGSAASNASHIVKYEWDFDDDGEFEVREAKPHHTFYAKGQHSVSLRITDSLGEMDVDMCNVYVGDSPPLASFTFSPEEPSLKNTIQFNDTSCDLDGSIISWLWDFGDGHNSTKSNPTHAYAEKGTYLVVLTVKDNLDELNTSKAYVNVVNIRPVADYTFSPRNPDKGQEVHFKDGSLDPDSETLDYVWDFGDGHTSTDQSPTHNYAEAGHYSVCLTVTDEEGETGTITKIVKVIRRHELILVVKDLLGFPVSKAEVKLYTDGECVVSDTTNERGVLSLPDMPEGLYEVQIRHLGLTTSIFCPLTGSTTEMLRVTFSLYLLGGMVGALFAVISLVIFQLIRRK